MRSEGGDEPGCKTTSAGVSPHPQSLSAGERGCGVHCMKGKRNNASLERLHLAILIIGGAGFIGLNLAEQLLAAGRAVTILDRAPPPRSARDAFARLPGRLTIETGDTLDHGQLSTCVARHRDGVIYGAAITAGPQREARDASMI